MKLLKNQKNVAHIASDMLKTIEGQNLLFLSKLTRYPQPTKVLAGGVVCGVA
jgi:hypothetical protein